MPAVSSSLEKIPQNPPISPALRPETIRHPDKRSKLENDATCGLERCPGAGTGSPGELELDLVFGDRIRQRDPVGLGIGVQGGL
jgi:hypothetical protein